MQDLVFLGQMPSSKIAGSYGTDKYLQKSVRTQIQCKKIKKEQKKQLSLIPAVYSQRQKNIPFKVTPNKISISGRYLTKEVKHLYNENLKILEKEYTREQEDYKCCWTGRCENGDAIKFTYIFNVIPIKMLTSCFIGLEKQCKNIYGITNDHEQPQKS